MHEMNSLVAAAREKKITEEEFLFHQQICRELDEAWEEMQKPGAKWLTEEEFWDGVKKAISL